MKIKKMEDVLRALCKDEKVCQVILRTLAWEQTVITQGNPHYNDELDAIVAEVTKKQ